jgi:glycerol uptake facilitator protein
MLLWGGIELRLLEAFVKRCTPVTRAFFAQPTTKAGIMGAMVGAFAIGRPFPVFREFLLYTAQSQNPVYGAAVMALHYAPHWSLTEDQAAKLGVFCTNGAVRHPAANFASEVIGTTVLVIVAGAIFSHGVSDNGPAAGIGQWLVASLVWGIGLSLGGTTGYAINPARDLGPRLVHWLLPIPGKGGSNWKYAPIPILGDLTGGAIAGLILHFAKL